MTENNNIIQRKKHLLDLKMLLKDSPAVGILGPRQVGKSTLAKQIGCDHFFDLENPRDLARLENPQVVLEGLSGIIAIDEIQRKPDLFPLLRFLIDQNRNQSFLILGSASRELISRSSETLAGRIQYLYLSGFNLGEVGSDQRDQLWLRGGFPRSYLADSDEASFRWRENFVADYLERDIPQLGISVPSSRLRRFWMMLSHYHGQTLNYAELARSMDLSEKTIKHYIDILASTFMVQIVHPWHNNTKKRLIKSPKLYLKDSGIFHYLQSIQSKEQLESHPKLGASWEGFAMFNWLEQQQISPQNAYYWGVHGRGELDLYWHWGGKSYGAEFKYSDAPKRSATIDFVMSELDLDHLWIIYPGVDRYQLDQKITVLPLGQTI